MSWQRVPLLLIALALAAQSLFIAAAAAYAAIADLQMDAWQREEDVLAGWHEPARYLSLATRLDPVRGAYFEARGLLGQLVADRDSGLRGERVEATRRDYAQALTRSPTDGILWARQAVLSLELEDYAEASVALGRVVEFGPFEPPARRIALATAFAHWRRIEPAGRQSILTLAGNGLIQVSEGSLRDQEAVEVLKRFAMTDMTCRHLLARGRRTAICRDRIVPGPGG